MREFARFILALAFFGLRFSDAFSPSILSLQTQSRASPLPLCSSVPSSPSGAVALGAPPVPSGPPGAVAPGGPPPRGGPPPQTKAQAALGWVFEKAWPMLYCADKSGIRDSSKNLRVLWARALLASLGAIDDPVAYDLLPRKTRTLVGPKAARALWSSVGKGAVKKLDWVSQRTAFIDGELQSWLEETKADSPERQVVVVGAGYDTRSLRFRRPGLQFFEVDLPDVSATKEAMIGRYLEGLSAGSVAGGAATQTLRPKHMGLDLNTLGAPGLPILKRLEAQLGFRRDVPTFVICEAVLFYLSPAAAQALTSDLLSGSVDSTRWRWVMVDNLAKVGCPPGGPPTGPGSPQASCASWLEREGRSLAKHDSIWGGSIHFAAIK